MKKFLMAAAASAAILMSGSAAMAEAVKLQLKWVTQAQFAGYYVAAAKGYYKAEGLDVKFVTARGGVDVAKQVGAGNAVIGGAIGDTPIIARAQGIPVKAVAVLGGKSLTQLVVRDATEVVVVAKIAGHSSLVQRQQARSVGLPSSDSAMTWRQW